MAVVDLATGKIVGAKEGSKVYYHELGHLEFNKSEKGILYSYYVWFSSFMTIIFLTISLFIHHWLVKAYALIFCSMMIYYYLYEEIWCWRFAFKEMKKMKGGQDGI